MKMLVFCNVLVVLVSCVEGGLTEYWTNEKPPINIYMDPNPPFYHGVKSGDPEGNFMILWTRATPRSSDEVANGVNVTWKIWDRVTGSEASPTLTGNATADPERDWTVKVDVGPLPLLNTTYYYRFYVADNPSESSRLGRTRTAPEPSTIEGTLTFAISSCSQHTLYQNTYSHAAYNMTIGGENPKHLQSWRDEFLLETEGINGFIDLGDYVYDVTEQTVYQRTWEGTCDPHPEKERPLNDVNRATQLDPAFFPLPMGSIMNCSWQNGDAKQDDGWRGTHTIDEFRWRHSMNLMDPDMRAAMASMPWIHVVDSHDVGNNQPTRLVSHPGLKVFEWWTPVRWKLLNGTETPSGEPEFRLHRKLSFGQIVDVMLLDTRGVGRDEDGLINPGVSYTYLGMEQREWLRDNINATQAWRIIGTGKAFTAWTLEGWQGFATGVAFGLICIPSLCLVCCFWSRRQLRKTAVESPLLSISAEPVESENPHKEEEDSKKTDLRMRERIINKSKMACASRGCIGCGFFSMALLLVIYIVVMVVGSKKIKFQEETQVLNPFATKYNWDGFPVDRAEVMKDLVDRGAQDNIFISGDMHMLAASNVEMDSIGHKILTGNVTNRNIPDYNNLNAQQNKVGVEWLPSSTSSRNIDDFLYSSVPFQGIIDLAADTAGHVIQRGNDHLKSFDTKFHGIGYIHLTSQEAQMQFYQNNVFFPFRQAKLIWTGVVKKGSHQWDHADFL